jgi:hypothetical protein
LFARGYNLKGLNSKSERSRDIGRWREIASVEQTVKSIALGLSSLTSDSSDRRGFVDKKELQPQQNMQSKDVKTKIARYSIHSHKLPRSMTLRIFLGTYPEVQAEISKDEYFRRMRRMEPEAILRQELNAETDAGSRIARRRKQFLKLRLDDQEAEMKWEASIIEKVKGSKS